MSMAPDGVAGDGLTIAIGWDTTAARVRLGAVDRAAPRPTGTGLPATNRGGAGHAPESRSPFARPDRVKAHGDLELA